MSAWARMHQRDKALTPYIEGETLEEAIKHIVEQSVAAHGGNVRDAAKALGISFSSIYRWGYNGVKIHSSGARK